MKHFTFYQRAGSGVRIKFDYFDAKDPVDPSHTSLEKDACTVEGGEEKKTFTATGIISSKWQGNDGLRLGSTAAAGVPADILSSMGNASPLHSISCMNHRVA